MAAAHAQGKAPAFVEEPQRQEQHQRCSADNDQHGHRIHALLQDFLGHDALKRKDEGGKQCRQ